jgi:hypothetical protein
MQIRWSIFLPFSDVTYYLQYYNTVTRITILSSSSFLLLVDPKVFHFIFDWEEAGKLRVCSAHSAFPWAGKAMQATTSCSLPTSLNFSCTYFMLCCHANHVVVSLNCEYANLLSFRHNCPASKLSHLKFLNPVQSCLVQNSWASISVGKTSSCFGVVLPTYFGKQLISFVAKRTVSLSSLLCVCTKDRTTGEK